MGIEEIVKLGVDNGLTVILISYFLYKDWKFNENILAVLGEIKEVLAVLKTHHEREEKENG